MKKLTTSQARRRLEIYRQLKSDTSALYSAGKITKTTYKKRIKSLEENIKKTKIRWALSINKI